MELPDIIHLPATPNAPERLNCIVIEEEGIAEVNPLLSVKTLSVYLEEQYNNALECYTKAKLTHSIEFLQIIVNIDTEYKDAKIRLGYYLLELEGIKKNKEIFTERIKNNARDTEALFYLADTYYVLNEEDEAEKIWQDLSSNKDYYGKKAKKMLEKYFNGNHI
jgi:tetratricopeptide (TPR) repeat protein